MNFEDQDLPKTIGRQVATHMDQAETDRRLAEAKQFGAYSRLAAFLMDDLNNLLAQQSLVVENAEKYRHNPDFVGDAISTISHSVDRMRRLMEQLSRLRKQRRVMARCQSMRAFAMEWLTSRLAILAAECPRSLLAIDCSDHLTPQRVARAWASACTRPGSMQGRWEAS